MFCVLYSSDMVREKRKLICACAGGCGVVVWLERILTFSTPPSKTAGPRLCISDSNGQYV